jgi:hypothetical protein
MLGGGDCESRTSSRAEKRAARDGVSSLARADLRTGDTSGVCLFDATDKGLRVLSGLATKEPLRNCGFDADKNDRDA